MGERGKLLKMYQAGAQSQASKTFLHNVAQMKADILQKKAEGVTGGKYLNELSWKLRNAINSALLSDLAEEKTALIEQLNLEAMRYQKSYDADLERNDIRARQAERKYRAMSRAELEAASMHTPDDPDAFDALCCELGDRDMSSEHEALRARGQMEHVGQPWRRTENGAEICKQLKLVEPVSGGGCLLQDEQGRTYAISLEDVLEALDDAEADDAE
jgi:hypothetical protein